jgi:hypothetical protein
MAKRLDVAQIWMRGIQAESGTTEIKVRTAPGAVGALRQGMRMRENRWEEPPSRKRYEIGRRG